MRGLFFGGSALDDDDYEDEMTREIESPPKPVFSTHNLEFTVPGSLYDIRTQIYLTTRKLTPISYRQERVCVQYNHVFNSVLQSNYCL